MNPKRISEADIGMFYLNNLFLYKNIPVYCEGHDGKYLKLIFLEHMKRVGVVFDYSLISPIPGRIGMVNTRKGVAFVQRRPVRRFNMGLSTDNTRITTVIGEDDGPRAEIRQLNVKNLFPAIMGNYPTFEECVATLLKNTDIEGRAFDRQFAVRKDGFIFYRNSWVGRVDSDKFLAGEATIEDIYFEAQHKHLSVLLGKKYETDFRNSRIA